MADEQLGLSRTLVPLRDTIVSTVELVGERYKDGLPVPVDVTGDDTVVVFADPERLVQVLRSLLDNAVKFSDARGRVTVSFAAVDGGRRVRIEIADQGVGIPTGDLPRIFDRFFQVDSSATRRFGGTGMGLALVKRLVSAHGASVHIESVEGEGTRVTLLWPADPDPADGGASAAAEEPETPPRRRRSAGPVVPVQ
ncbi:MAG TPA: ATP-binding protein [Candidatus Dormibacteraeota bacterium]